MKAFRILTIAAAAVVIITAAASSDTINTIEEIEQTALLNNLEYKTAVLEVQKADNSLEGILKLDGTSLSISGAYSQPDNNSFNYQASLSLPVIDQLSLNASVDQDLKANFGIDFNPLSHSQTVEQTKLTYTARLAAAEDKAEEVSDNAVAAYLAWGSAAADYEVKQKTVAVKKILYDDEKIRFDMSESNLDEVRDAFTAWSDSRTALNKSLSTLQAAETVLYSALNVDPADVTIEQASAADLSSLITVLDTELGKSELSIGGSLNLLNAENAIENLELQLSAIWLFEPDLKIGGTLEISPENSQPSLSATASLSFGLDDWNATKREELEVELEISRQQAAQIISSEQLSLQQAITTEQTAAINYKVAEIELQQAEELLDEAGFLYELGEYSQAELEETALLYEQSQNGLFKAAAEHYTALRSLIGFAE